MEPRDRIIVGFFGAALSVQLTAISFALAEIIGLLKQLSG